MKLIPSEIQVQRTIYQRGTSRFEPSLLIYKTVNWYTSKAPFFSKKKWWQRGEKIAVRYKDCPKVNYEGNIPKTPCHGNCYISKALNKRRHRVFLYAQVGDAGWRAQMRGLCIERNLQSWVFRHRYRKKRNAAALKIQKWWKIHFPKLIFKQAKAHWNSLHGL